MTVSNSRLAIDSSLSIGDAKFVRRACPSRSRSRTSASGSTEMSAGSRRSLGRLRPTSRATPVVPARTYVEVLPKGAPPSLVGTSVKLSIAVESTKGKVLAVPIGALSVAADGTSRVHVDLGPRQDPLRHRYPGLAAQGFVEVTSTGPGRSVRDLVVVGSRSGAARKAPTGKLGTYHARSRLDRGRRVSAQTPTTPASPTTPATPTTPEAPATPTDAHDAPEPLPRGAPSRRRPRRREPRWALTRRSSSCAGLAANMAPIRRSWRCAAST